MIIIHPIQRQRLKKPFSKVIFICISVLHIIFPISPKLIFFAVDKKFLAIARDKKLKDGSTGLVALALNDKLYVANAGDSRGISSLALFVV